MKRSLFFIAAGLMASWIVMYLVYGIALGNYVHLLWVIALLIILYSIFFIKRL